MNRLFQDHPNSVGETYTEHWRQAWSFSGQLFLAAFACFVHGLLPFCFERTGSGKIQQLYRRMVTHRVRHQGGEAAMVTAEPSA